MIKEDYVTFEQAKLLKEKGFPQNSVNWGFIYTRSGVKEFYSPRQVYRNMNVISCPTLSLVQKWLREANNLFISVWLNSEGTICWNIDKIGEGDKMTSASVFDTYEEALSNAITYSLNLI